MSDYAIRVEGLGKQYRIGVEQASGMYRYKSLRDSFGGIIKRPWQTARTALLKEQMDESNSFWALKDINFEVKRGEVVGIIGRNGAGKSTLLKILSRITKPTTGHIELRGRVGSLLEVGTGFHPELSGRENIYLNGAILGMTRAEVKSKFDEIIAFSEIEKFLDTPVKHYSSGMYTRLAFAVAAHLESEILIVDEVLAVGDAEFQKKCLGKMSEVAKYGRTVLFVSHNMLAIQKLCRQALLLKSGRAHAQGRVADIIETHADTPASGEYLATPSSERPTVTLARLLTPVPKTTDKLKVEIEWYLPHPIPGIKIGIGFNTADGQRIFDSTPEDLSLTSPNDQGYHRATLTVPAGTLLSRAYLISIGLWRDSVVFDHQPRALRVMAEAVPIGRYAHESTCEGLVTINCRWHLLH